MRLLLLALLFPLPALAAGEVPGRIEAERFDPGGEGVGYHDTTRGNQGRAYRVREDVDIAADRGASGGYFVSWISRGEWLRYGIHAAFDARFAVTLRVSTPYEGRRLHLDIDGEHVIRSLALPRTGGWNRFVDTPSRIVRLAAGSHDLRVFFETDGLSLDAIDFQMMPDPATGDHGPELDETRDREPGGPRGTSHGTGRAHVGGLQ